MLRTAGGITINQTTNFAGYYGSFYSTANQSDGANSIIPMAAEKTFDADGVTMADNGAGKLSLITFAHAGTYNIQFSTVFQDTGGGGGGAQYVNVWFRYNGSNIANSNTKFAVANAAPIVIAGWNFIQSVAGGDTVEIVWETTNASIQASYIAATGDMPATPSIIITASQIR